ncbi:MAG: carboxypeptidase-like regulatory domain-containing protein [Bacteroidetes bacterium]|nr:carboxypeptidase-like regulatory domain-containing protein [Bacteroidota bacterium]
MTDSAVQRYLKGEMSAREMHELEKAALEDPFLADALEGFESQPLQPHLDELHTRLEARIAQPERKTVPLFRSRFLRIAAAVILLVGLGSTAWYLLLNKQENYAYVAKDTQPSALASQHSAASANERPADTVANTVTSTWTAPAKAKKLNKSSVATKPEEPSIAKTETHEAEAEKISAARAPDDDFRKQLTKKQDSTQEYKAAFFKNPTPILLSGKVLDANNNPLPGASLQLTADKNIGTVTDQQGLFNLKVYPNPKAFRRDSLPVTVDLVGYKRNDLVLNTFDNTSAANIIHLEPQSNALDEVVVVRDNRLGASRRMKEFRAAAPYTSTEKVDSLWIKVEPVVGKQAYLAYLTEGKKTLGADSTIHGVVIISFDVNKKGDLDLFKVEQSLTPAHDAGLIRLISEGPGWKVKKGRSARAAVSLVF